MTLMFATILQPTGFFGEIHSLCTLVACFVYHIYIDNDDDDRDNSCSMRFLQTYTFCMFSVQLCTPNIDHCVYCAIVANCVVLCSLCRCL